MMIGAFALAAQPQSEAKRPIPKNLPSGAKLFVAPMDWNLDGFIRSGIIKKGLPVALVGRPQDADYVMTASAMKLGSRLLSPGRDFQVKIEAADTGSQIWSAEASDYATFFARLRSHGAGRAANSIVRQLRNRFFKPGESAK
jgi:hypothetical protein